MSISLSACLVFAAVVFAAPQGTDIGIVSSMQPAGTVHLSLANEIDAAVERGLDWLAAHQKEDGSWSNGEYPALTALPLRAFARSSHPKKKQVTDKAVDFILGCVKKDGGIYCKKLSNYNTAISMTALHATGRPDVIPVVQKARKFIAGSQHFGDDDYKGGFGYDRSTGRAYTDLLNTFYAAEAMRLTQDVEDLRDAGEKRVDVDWAETVKYIERLQNRPAAGPDDAGGFHYSPNVEKAKAGSTTNEAGVVVFRSYGSITYSGLLALIYANVSRDDARVRSAFDWSCRHWSLEENPGMGAQGLFFFYNVLTKALAAYGQGVIPREGAEPLNWKEEVAGKLVSTQKIDPDGLGHWINDTGRFWENDPVLATAYAILALQEL